MADYISVIGGINIDMNGVPFQPLQMETSNPGQVHISPGGVARNIAHNLGLLGVPVNLLGIVGNDVFGHYVREETRQAGVNVEQVIAVNGQRTGAYLSVLDEHRDLSVAVSDLDIMRYLTAADLARHESVLANSAFVVADANLEEEALQYISDLCQHRHIPYLLEPVSFEKAKKLCYLAGKATYVTPNRRELEVMTGRKRSVLREQCASLQPFYEHILVTLGERGVYHYECDTGQETLFPAIPTRIVNVNGAGDAFVAGFVCGLFHQHPIAQAIRLGIAAAHLTLQARESVNNAISLSTCLSLAA